MTFGSKKFGRPSTYGLGAMAVGDTVNMPAPTRADVKRIARNTSQYGIRTDTQFRCRTDRATRVTTVTRIR
jgi:hypothetical protein